MSTKKKYAVQTSYRNVFYTLNNYTPEEEAHLKGLDVVYQVMGWEVGKKMHTPHIHGYIELKKQMKFKALKKMLGERANFGARIGTQEQVIRYVTKDGVTQEFGTKKKQGKRGDLDDTRQLAVDGGMRSVTTTCNFQQIRVAEKYLTYNEEARDFKTTVIWIYGPSGSGKSRLAREIVTEYGDVDDLYTKNDATKWWEGYDRHEWVIMDDFRDSWWPVTETLRVLDRYECRLECKGGYRQLRAKVIIITSVKPPEQHYLGVSEPRAQLMRRIDLIIPTFNL